ncbi:hypothetical protein BSKO_04621 [Bryopsis sp. KO-2023]|nr:hypothetical protein BSKO_04621 [Bryopsis sp. KO-2023]
MSWGFQHNALWLPALQPPPPMGPPPPPPRPPLGPPPSHTASFIFPVTRAQFCLAVEKKFVDVEEKHWVHVREGKWGTMVSLLVSEDKLLYGRFKISGKVLLVEQEESCVARVPIVCVDQVPPVHEQWFLHLMSENFYGPGQFIVALNELQTQGINRLLFLNKEHAVPVEEKPQMMAVVGKCDGPSTTCGDACKSGAQQRTCILWKQVSENHFGNEERTPKLEGME